MGGGREPEKLSEEKPENGLTRLVRFGKIENVRRNGAQTLNLNN